MLEMRRLRLLHAFAGYGTVNAAAAAMHVSGSAVSQQIAALEREVGMPLVRRQGRGLKLTHAGRVLVAHTDVLLDQLGAAEADLITLRGEIAGIVRVASFSSATATLVADAWRSVAEEHGGKLVLKLLDMEPEDSVVALARDETELAVAHCYDLLPFSRPPGYERHDLLIDPVLVALPEHDPQADQTHVDLTALKEHAWLSVPVDTSCHEMLRRACGLAGFVPNVIAHSADYPAVLALVAAGAGVTLLPMLCARHLPAGVVTRELRQPIQREIFALTRHGGERQPAVGVVLDHLRRAADRYRGPLVS